MAGRHSLQTLCQTSVQHQRPEQYFHSPVSSSINNCFFLQIPKPSIQGKNSNNQRKTQFRIERTRQITVFLFTQLPSPSMKTDTTKEGKGQKCRKHRLVTQTTYLLRWKILLQSYFRIIGIWQVIFLPHFSFLPD